MKKTVLLAIACACSSVVNANCQQGYQCQGQVPTYGQNQQGPTYQGQNYNYNYNDQALANKIMNALDKSKYSNVNVMVNNGVVVLQGTVAAQADREDLNKKVSEMSGVRSVNNQVTIQKNGYQQGQTMNGNHADQNYQGTNQYDDQTLTSRIQDSLSSTFTNRYDNVTVTVNNGYVTLQGTVASQSDKDDLEKKVGSMDGVRGVKNQVTISQSQNR